MVGWQNVLYESIKLGAEAVTPYANSLFWKLESNAWRFCRILYHITNIEALTVLCFVVKFLEAASKSTQDVGRNTRQPLVFPLHFLRALAVSRVLYNRTEHSQSFYICYMIKKKRVNWDRNIINVEFALKNIFRDQLWGRIRPENEFRRAKTSYLFSEDLTWLPRDEALYDDIHLINLPVSHRS